MFCVVFYRIIIVFVFHCSRTANPVQGNSVMKAANRGLRYWDVDRWNSVCNKHLDGRNRIPRQLSAVHRPAFVKSRERIVHQRRTTASHEPSATIWPSNLIRAIVVKRTTVEKTVVPPPVTTSKNGHKGTKIGDATTATTSACELTVRIEDDVVTTDSDSDTATTPATVSSSLSATATNPATTPATTPTTTPARTPATIPATTPAATPATVSSSLGTTAAALTVTVSSSSPGTSVPGTLTSGTTVRKKNTEGIKNSTTDIVKNSTTENPGNVNATNGHAVGDGGTTAGGHKDSTTAAIVWETASRPLHRMSWAGNSGTPVTEPAPAVRKNWLMKVTGYLANRRNRNRQPAVTKHGSGRTAGFAQPTVRYETDENEMNWKSFVPINHCGGFLGAWTAGSSLPPPRYF